MAAVDVGARNHPPVPNDDLDDLFDYEVPADIFQDVDTNMEVPNRPAKAPLGDAGKDNGTGLGIDEEIKVTKTRGPVAKLDEARLLSQAGIPKLRKITKERLKFKGKGHEYSDVVRLLNVYQLWLDDLYPRAKFADGLAMIEKMGHKKRMQMMRKEWINERKPKDKYDDAEPAPKAPERNQLSESSVQHQASDDNRAVKTQTSAADDWSDDALFGPPKAPRESKIRLSQDASADSLFVSDDEGGNDAPPEDDLDVLLAEDEINTKTSKTAPLKQNDSSGKRHDNFEDEMEVMAGLDDMW